MLSAAPADPGSSGPASAGRDGAGSLRRGDGSRFGVLIVEDEPFVALDLQAMIEDLGGRAEIAHTVAAARRAAEAARPELVLMDIRLPDGDGVDLAGELRGRFAPAIVFVTASTDADTLARIGRLGRFEIVHKPVNAVRLARAVVAAVGAG
jgi:DNA-binding response OmpR family regulator